MDKLATVVIPISPEHRQMGIYQDAIDSVAAQSLPCDLITVVDHEKRGAAWARNQGTAEVQTPFVIWLDADDILLPRFVECTVDAYQQGAFVYTDWRLHGVDKRVPPVLSPFTEGQEHVITTLMPLAAWRDSGGFDESLDTLEDEDYYRRIQAYGWRGVKANEVLIDYRRNRGFSKVNLEAVDPDIQRARVAEKKALFEKRYGRFSNMYVFVSNKQKPTTPIAGERKANDVLCEATYSPMKQVGAVTRRSYPRAGLNEPIWVDHDDALARPDLFRIIAHNPDKIAPDVERVKELYERAKQANEVSQVPIENRSMVSVLDGSETTPIAMRNAYDLKSLAELKQIFADKGLDESEVTGGVSVHWKIQRKLMISYLKDLEDETPNPRVEAVVENS